MQKLKALAAATAAATTVVGGASMAGADTVQSGDTLIGRYGDSWGYVCIVNVAEGRIPDCNTLATGQELRSQISAEERHNIDVWMAHVPRQPVVVEAPSAPASTYQAPAGGSDEQLLTLADILPTGYEVGVLNGAVSPGDVVAVVGAGPIGLSAIMGARLFSPAHVVAIDLADSRLEAAKQFGADVTVNNGREDPASVIAGLTDGLGADVAMEAVGVPATFELAAQLIRPGGRVANIGVHGEPATLHLEDLWIRNVTITTGLVDTYSTPTLLKLTESHQVDVGRFITHHFGLADFMEAYEVFGNAADTGALKVVLTA